MGVTNRTTVKVIFGYSSTGCTCYLKRCISYFDSSAGSEVNIQQLWSLFCDGHACVSIRAYSYKMNKWECVEYPFQEYVIQILLYLYTYMTLTLLSGSTHLFSSLRSSVAWCVTIFVLERCLLSLSPVVLNSSLLEWERTTWPQFHHPSD